MKTICETKNLHKAIEAVMPGVEPKTNMEILKGIKIEAKDNEVFLSTSNLNNYYISHLESKNESDGIAVVAAERFHNIIKATNAEEVTLETKEKNSKTNRLVIKAGKAIFELSTYNENDFPSEPETENDPDFSLELSGELYKEMIKKTAYATSKDTARPLFNGIYINLEKDSADFVGTNTHRISEYKIMTAKFKGLEEKNKNRTCLVPAENLAAIGKIISNDETITLSYKKNTATLKTEKWKTYIRTIEGKFPDYKRVIPKEADKQTEITVNRMALLNAVNRVSLCSDTESGYMIIKMEADNDKLIISSHGSNVSNSQGQETVDCKTEGNPIKAAFNAKYIIEYCKSTTTENINMELKNSISPVKIYGDDADKYIYIMTPVRVIF